MLTSHLSGAPKDRSGRPQPAERGRGYLRRVHELRDLRRVVHTDLQGHGRGALPIHRRSVLAAVQGPAGPVDGADGDRGDGDGAAGAVVDALCAVDACTVTTYVCMNYCYFALSWTMDAVRVAEYICMRRGAS